jgi:LysW-gamma-L-lysine carboxypeptidase
VSLEPTVQLLKGALDIYSPTGSTEEIGKYFVDWAKDHGMDAEMNNGMAVVNPKAEKLLMLGHMDTVYGELPVEKTNGSLTGRGAADAKGPLCAAIAAVQQHPELYEHVRIVGAPDEEGPSEAAKYIRDNWPERPCIILEPSTWQGITLSYMGRLFIRCKTSCPPSHSGHLKPFATEILSAVWAELAQNPIVRMRNINGSEIEAQMELDIRFRDQPVEEILAGIPENVEVEEIERTTPYTANKNTLLTRAFLRAVREVGGTPVFKKKTGTSDMNVIGEKWTIAPMLAYGPGDGRLGHTNDEKIEIDDYLKGISVLKKALGFLMK